MIDLRPISHVVARLIVMLGVMMLGPAVVDLAAQDGNAPAFFEASLITTCLGALTALATRNAAAGRLDIRQAYLLTLLIWLFLPGFATLPFMIGAPHLGFTDAYFEAVSGITTTGSTVIVGLDHLPAGINLWRGLLNWLGGLGIAFVAMIFFPVMRVGGMQFFRTEGFDTFGKILPRAADLALSLLGVYLGLTLVFALVYHAVGMTLLDATIHAFATIATGGFSGRDASFGTYPGAGEYAGAVFMLLSGIPYVRYVQLLSGNSQPLWQDPQVRAYLRWIATAILAVTLWRVATVGGPIEPIFRDAAFNLVSIFTGTGFFSGGFSGWGGFALVVAFTFGFIGGCSGSSTGALSVFRVQVALAAIAAQLRQITSPNRIAPLRYDGRAVETDTLSGVMMYVTTFVLLTGVLSICLAVAGADMFSALFAVWASLGNIGYGFGPMVADTGTFVDFNMASKWILIVAMLLGRLSLMALLLLVMPRFWRY
jgi:trk system potassium uptake protein TrkH